MPSKKKSKKGKGKKAAKAMPLNAQMQRLKVNTTLDDDDAFLDEAIKLATAEKEAQDAADIKAAELHDETLFKKPVPSEEDDCPICFLPFPEDFQKRQYQVCCGTYICTGCIQAHWEDKDELDCPFCRMVVVQRDDEYIKRIEKRVDVNDAEAINFLACKYSTGQKGLSQDHAKALDLWMKAAELGSAPAYRNIAAAYHDGRGVRQNSKKEKYYHEMAAIRGYNSSRSVLGTIEWNERNFDRAYKHWTIAAEAGNTEALKELKEGLQLGYVTDIEYERIMKCYQDSLDAEYSEQRLDADQSLRSMAESLGINNFSYDNYL